MTQPATRTNRQVNWTETARYYEYTSAADPSVPAIPYVAFPATLHAGGPSRVIELDLARHLATDVPATAPNLLANFVVLAAGAPLTTQAQASSQMAFVLRGKGRTRSSFGTLEWSAGDLWTMPAGGDLVHEADLDAALYWVHDAPLLAYLGATPCQARFTPTLYPAARLQAELARVNAEEGARTRNRNGVLLGNEATPLTLTLTPVLWSLYNLLPRRSWQKPHRHNSVALDLCVAAEEGVYTLIGETIDPEGRIVNPMRADWKPGAVFVTPPGLWHSHHNDSDSDAIVLPVQDAGLHTWMRTLDIRFS